MQLQDSDITKVIQDSLALRGVQALQQELVEGLRNGDPRGYPYLRKLLERLAAVGGPQ